MLNSTGLEELAFDAAAYELLQEKVKALNLQFADKVAAYDECLDTIWMLLCGFLAFFQNAGFSMWESGHKRFKSSQVTLSNNLLQILIAFLAWWSVGYAFGLGVSPDPGRFVGSANFFMEGFWASKEHFRMWFFQGVFGITSLTIASGAMAERTQLQGFCAFAAVYQALIYPVVSYWCRSGAGFLNMESDGGASSIIGPALIDQAGGGFVHLCGATASLTGAIIVGARRDRWSTHPQTIREFHSPTIPFCVLGTFFLWFGFYGLNAGAIESMKIKKDGHLAGLIACNTTLPPCMAGLVVLVLRLTVVEPKKLDVAGFCGGILAGCVSMAAGCAVLRPVEGIAVGFIAGFVYQGAMLALVRLRVDDVAGTVPIHGACGIWGLLAVGIFGNPADGIGGNGLLYGGNQLPIQILTCICIIVWGVVTTGIVFTLLLKVGILREEETAHEIFIANPPKDWHTRGEEASALQADS